MVEHTNLHSSEPSVSWGLPVCLYLAAGLSAAGGVLIGLARLFQAPPEGNISLEAWAHAAESLLQGLVWGAVLWSAAWFLRRREESLRLQRRMLRVLTNLSRPEEASPASETENRPRSAPKPPADLPAGIRQTNWLQRDSWNRATEPTERHGVPADPLLARVQRDSADYQAEQRRRLFAVIQEHAQMRQWKQALAGAHKLLETYGDSEEAQTVRSMLPTLVDNARIQEVRELRDRIVNLVEQHHYAQAVPLIRQVVENYPETAAATELRSQLPRLMELARLEENAQQPPVVESPPTEE